MDSSTGVLIQPMEEGSFEFLIDNRSLAQNHNSHMTMDTIQIDMPDKSDGTLTKVPVLLQMPEELRTLGDSRGLEALEDTLDLTKFDQLNADAISVLSTPLLDKINLEDFVDVVTTYQCKFCRFSCAWKSGLMSHIRNAHITQKLALTSSSLTSDSTQLLSLPTAAESSPTLCQTQNLITMPSVASTLELRQAIDAAIMAPLEESSPMNVTQTTKFHKLVKEFQAPAVQEKQIFLCGSCHQGFDSLDICKRHMVLEHQVQLEAEETGNKISKRKSIKPRKKRQCMELEREMQEKLKRSFNVKELVESETLSKRKVRPPKALTEDYYLSLRKRKYSRRQTSQDKLFRCEFKSCNIHFHSEENLQYHMRCHKQDERLFQCVECLEKAEHWRSMAMHLWKEHQVDLDLYSCLICGYRTCSSFKLENHRRIHSEERLFVCSVCRKGFKQMSQLRNHQVVHVDRKNMTEKRWFCEQKCDTCNRNFSDSKCLRKHMQAVHNKVRPFSCSFCGHTSARKAMLQLHMRCHTGEKPFVCDMCDYRTGDHNSLRRHKMRHSGDKPYKCRHCNYACIQAISYKTHMKNKHPNSTEGLFCCALCNFRSVSQDNYVNHMSDHKRGAIPVKAEEVAPETEPEAPANQQEVVTLNGVSSMAQLESLLPGNVSTAQLIYSCLNALTQQNQQNCDLPPGVSSTTVNGVQMIAIQIPNEQGGTGETDHIYLTLQQPTNDSELVEGGNAELEASPEEGNPLTLEPEQAQALLDSLERVEFTA